jgi:hypothetical protein
MRRTLMGSLMLLMVVTSALQADDKPARYVEKEGGFSFVLPPDWKVREFPGFKYQIAHGPAADGFAPNINFADEAFRGKLSDYVTANKRTLSAVFKDYKELGEAELKTDDGMPCIRLVAQCNHQGKVLRQTFYFFDLAPGRKLVATCSALADGGEKLDPVFEASLKTFRVEKR